MEEEKKEALRNCEMTKFVHERVIEIDMKKTEMLEEMMTAHNGLVSRTTEDTDALLHDLDLNEVSHVVT